MLLGKLCRVNNDPDKLSRILSGVGFSILTAFFGVSIAWIGVLILQVVFDSHGDSIIAGCEPILTAGGVIGLVSGLIVSMRVAKSDPKTRQKIEKRFVGRGGQMQIYFGAPAFIVAVGTPLILGRLTHTLGDNGAAYVWLGFIAVVLVVSLIIREHIPERFIIPIGIIGWLLIVLGAFGLCIYMMHQPI
jgi:hypothetical protein